jgi:hypothetical protein
MRWSGALTLGVVLILGGATSGWGQDLTSSGDVASAAAGPPSWGGLRPSLPDNWSDLPVKFHVSESLGYNSNVTGVPTGTSIFGPQLGDFFSSSNYGVSGKAPWEGEQFFFDVSGGVTRYLREVNQDTNNYSGDVGVNWIYTSRCSGTLVASATQSPYNSPQSRANPGQTVPGQPINPITQPTFVGQVGFGLINVVTTKSFNETATCQLSGNYSAIFNSGFTTSSNSTASNTANPNAANNFQDVFVAAGITYSVTSTNSLQALATLTSTNYTNRGTIASSAGLAAHTDQLSFNITYTKQFDSKFSMSASLGVAGVNNSGNGLFSFGLPSGFEPQYSLSATWAPTPKLSFNASVAQSVTPPQGIISNAQLSRTASLGMSYPITPKLSFSASASVGEVSSAFTSLPGTVTNALSSFGSQKFHSANANLSYTMTPFLGANLSYSYSTSQQTGFNTPQSTVTLAVNYAPY